jgi:MFS family permease
VISNLIFITARSFEAVLISWVLGVVGDAFWRPGFSAIWIDVIPRNRRARMFSIRTIVAGISSSVAYSVSGFLYAKKEVYPFIVVILVELLMIPLLFYLKEPEVKEI